MTVPAWFATRRDWFQDCGRGLGGIALASLLGEADVQKSGFASEGEAASVEGLRLPHLPPRAKNVIWLFMTGGVSQLESFDPKPALNDYAGQEIGNTPFKECLDSPHLKDNLRVVVPNDANGQQRQKLYPLQVGYRKRGESGIEISDWWPHVGNVVDELAIVRSMWTTDNNHGAQLQFHTGRHNLDGVFPTIGSWVHYGLGTLNENLPQFVVLGEPIADCCGGSAGHGSDYLGPEHSGVRLKIDPQQPLPFATPPASISSADQQARAELLRQLHQQALLRAPGNQALRARMQSYELAFRMQRSVVELMQFESETEATQQLYGLDRAETKSFGQMCLTARRMVERGVRFVQLFHGSNGGAGAWDAHGDLKQNHATLSLQVDQPIAALIHDLKRSGLLDETLVVWGTEFGRTPGAQGTGRDHHPFAFSVWMAGGGVKGGVVHGATDPIGFHAIENRHYVTDVHATVLHQLGLDSRRMEWPSRKRLEMDHGHVIHEILA
jgi:hypothetical protein